MTGLEPHPDDRPPRRQPQASRPLRVVHLSGDFPDPVDAAKSPVVRALAQLTEGEVSHEVYSINRRSPSAGGLLGAMLRSPRSPKLEIASDDFRWGEGDQARGHAVVYRAPPRGLFHATMLHRLGDWLAEDLHGRPCDLLVGHKLAIEGVAVRRASRRLQIPYALSIQGNTDEKILRARPDLRRLFAAVFHEAQVVMPFAPWALSAAEKRLGRRDGPVRMLPCPTDLDVPLAPVPGDGSVVTAFHLRNHTVKNLDNLVRAARILHARGEQFSLDVIGGGDAQVMRLCSDMAAGLPEVRFAGPADRAALRSRFNAASGFVLPSRRESYGLVFIEALFAGLPIAYPAGAAVDGYFDGMRFALRIDSKDPSAIADAMLHLVSEEAALKAELADWQGSLHARKFMRSQIAATYLEALSLAARAAPAPAKVAA